MLEMKSVGDNFKMLVTVLAILVTNILYFLTLASGCPTSKRWHQDLKFVAKILKLSPTVSHQHHNVTNMTLAVELTLVSHVLSFSSFFSDLETKDRLSTIVFLNFCSNLKITRRYTVWMNLFVFETIKLLSDFMSEILRTFSCHRPLCLGGQKRR